jgi:hypothetical protein
MFFFCGNKKAGARFSVSPVDTGAISFLAIYGKCVKVIRRLFKSSLSQASLQSFIGTRQHLLELNLQI